MPASSLKPTMLAHTLSTILGIGTTSMPKPPKPPKMATSEEVAHMMRTGYKIDAAVRRAVRAVTRPTKRSTKSR